MCSGWSARRAISVLVVSATAALGAGGGVRSDAAQGAIRGTIAPGPRTGPPFFGRERPKVIVLIHGQSDHPHSDDPNDIVGRLAHARKEWGYAFVCGLLDTRPGKAIYTFSGGALTSGSWPEDAYVSLTGEAHLPHYYARDGVVGDHFVSTSPERRDLSVMLTHRDASKSLEAQAAAAANQIYDLYNAAFGSGTGPQIILLAHSMGGLVSRYILSNPFPAGSPQRQKADFIRDRTLFLITLASPHDGSRVADSSQALINLIRSALPDLRILCAFLPMPNVGDNAVKLLQQLGGAVGQMDDPSTRNLTTASIERMNGKDGPLQPHLARRTDGSLVPVYCLSGRDPSAGCLEDPLFRNVTIGGTTFPVYLGGTEKARSETSGLIVADQAFKLLPVGGNTWGTVEAGSVLDRIQRVTVADLAKDVVEDVLGLIETDHVVSRLVNEYGGGVLEVGIGHTDFTIPVYLDRKWKVVEGACELEYKHLQYKNAPNIKIPYDDCPDLLTLDPIRDAVKIIEVITVVLTKLQYNVVELAKSFVGLFNPDNWELKETVSFPCPKLKKLTSPASDGEVDSDGFVGIDSALGVYLSTGIKNYFDHSEIWVINLSATQKTEMRGSWYRYYGTSDDCVWRRDNHGTIRTNAKLSRWLYNELITMAGPTVVAGPISTF